MPIARRAYSEADKLRREELIVVAAQELLAAKGYFGFSMNDVVAATGLAKGTLYLYFTTKEELCLTVYEREALAWLGELAPVLAELPTPAAPEQIARVLASSAAQRPLLARLTALAPLHFEANVSSERARKHKLLLLRALRPAGRLIEQRAGLRPDDGRVLLVRMQVIMAGRAQQRGIGGAGGRAHHLVIWEALHEVPARFALGDGKGRVVLQFQAQGARVEFLDGDAHEQRDEGRGPGARAAIDAEHALLARAQIDGQLIGVEPRRNQPLELRAQGVLALLVARQHDEVLQPAQDVLVGGVYDHNFVHHTASPWDLFPGGIAFGRVSRTFVLSSPQDTPTRAIAQGEFYASYRAPQEEKGGRFGKSPGELRGNMPDLDWAEYDSPALNDHASLALTFAGDRVTVEMSETAHEPAVQFEGEAQKNLASRRDAKTRRRDAEKSRRERQGFFAFPPRFCASA